MQARLGTLIVASFAVVASGCTEEDGICNALDLETALFNAFQGDSVRLGACSFAGAFMVPEGVTLEGAGKDSSILLSSGNDPVLSVTSGALAPRVSDLTVDSTASAAIVVRGGGRAELERVAVRAAVGIGIGIEGLEEILIQDVELSGPVSAENAESVSAEPSSDVIATHGLVVVDTVEVDMRQVSATGFARMGVLLIAEETTWREGSASDNLATGVLVHGGHAVLEDLVLCRTFQGLSLIPAYAGVFVAGARVETNRLEVCECEGPGLFHDGSNALHVELNATENSEAAVWAQRSSRFELSGTSTLSDNDLAGLVLIEVEETVVNTTRVESTHDVLRVVGMSSITVGDGIQVVRPAGPVSLRQLDLIENARIGLLVDLDGGEPDDITLSDVSVDGQGSQLGALLQGSTVPAGWEAGLDRQGATVENDANHGGDLPTLNAVAQEDYPLVDEIIDEGLAWLLAGP